MSIRPDPCRHERWEPVESIVTGERLGTICVDCLVALPLTYDGAVTAISTWNGAVITYAPVA